VFYPKENLWKRKAPLLTYRSGISGVTLNNKIYVFGGESKKKTFNQNERFDPENNKWGKCPPMPTSRHGLSAVTDGEKIYVIGGGPKPGISYSSVNEVFVPTN